jgi:CheY-like chemotaxis protein
MPFKILVVEDHFDSRDYLSLLLSLKGYTIFAAENGLEGLKQVEAKAPDLIISDLTMPELDGVEMITALREKPEYSQLPIIVVTAYTDNKVADAIHAGANFALRKPLDAELLYDLIEQLLPQ